MSVFKIESNNRATTTAHDLQANTKTQAPKFIKTLGMAQVDNKALYAKVYSMAVEEADGLDSFIAEADLNKEGLSKEHQEQKAIIDEMMTRAVEMEEDTMIATITAYKEYGSELFGTEWTNDRGNMTIRTKYLFESTYGIISKELKTSPSKETYTIAQPSIRGLAGFRAEMSNNSHLFSDEDFETFRQLHNNHCLLINAIEPETEIFEQLAEIDETDPTAKKYSQGGVFIIYNKGFISYIANDKLKPTAKPTTKQRDF